MEPIRGLKPGNYKAVKAAKIRRNCTCGTTLSKYNLSTLCSLCERNK